MINPPSFPKLTMMSPDGLLISSPGYKVGEQVNGMSAYQNTIIPPEGKEKTDQRIMGMGQTVFKRAQCISCHSGEAYTNNRIVSSKSSEQNLPVLWP
jgi:mono/diheme cytochrome c family protein